MKETRDALSDAKARDVDLVDWKFRWASVMHGLFFGRRDDALLMSANLRQSTPLPPRMLCITHKSSHLLGTSSYQFSRMTNTLDTEFHSFESRKRMIEKLMGSYYKVNLTDNYIWLQLMMLNECVREFCKGS